MVYKSKPFIWPLGENSSTPCVIITSLCVCGKCFVSEPSLFPSTLACALVFVRLLEIISFKKNLYLKRTLFPLPPRNSGPRMVYILLNSFSEPFKSDDPLWMYSILKPKTSNLHSSSGTEISTNRKNCKLKYAFVKYRSSRLKIWNYNNLIFGASLLAAVFWSSFRTNLTN